MKLPKNKKKKFLKKRSEAKTTKESIDTKWGRLDRRS